MKFLSIKLKKGYINSFAVFVKMIKKIIMLTEIKFTSQSKKKPDIDITTNASNATNASIIEVGINIFWYSFTSSISLEMGFYTCTDAIRDGKMHVSHMTKLSRACKLVAPLR